MSLLDRIMGAGSASLTPSMDTAQMRIPFVVELRQTNYDKPTPDALARDILTQVGFTSEDIAAFNRQQGFDVQRFLADGIKQGGIDCAALVRNADHPNGAAQVSLMKGNLERLQTFLTERRAAQTPTASASERQGYNTAEQRRAAVEAKLPPPPPPASPSPVKADNQESVGAFIEGAIAGDFSDNDSWSATAGKIIGGLNPLADVRDIAAGVTHVAQGKDGAGFELGASLLGAIPVVGDAGKAILRGGRKVATEVAEEAAERAAKETAERTAKQSTEQVRNRIIDEAVLPSNVTTRQRQLFERPTTQGDAHLPAGTGGTDKYGNIRYSTAGTVEEQSLVRHHEKVHQFFSPKFKLLREFRADVGMTAYQKSSLCRYLEEACAESYAQLRVNGLKGLPEGIKFPITNGYVELKDVIKEGAIGTIVVGGTTYGVHVVATAVNSGANDDKR